MLISPALWLCANLSPTLHGFSLSLPIYWKAWQMSVACGTGHPGLLSYCCGEQEIRTFNGDLCVLFLWFFIVLSFEPSGISSLISFIFEMPHVWMATQTTKIQQQYSHGADDLVTVFPLPILNAIFYLFQTASLLRYLSSDLCVRWEEKYLSKLEIRG